MFSSFGRFSWIWLCFQIVGQLRIKTCQHFEFHFWKCWQKLRQFEIDRKLYYYYHFFLQNPNTFTLYWRLHKNLFTVYHLIVSCFYLHNIFHIKKKVIGSNHCFYFNTCNCLYSSTSTAVSTNSSTVLCLNWNNCFFFCSFFIFLQIKLKRTKMHKQYLTF